VRDGVKLKLDGDFRAKEKLMQFQTHKTRDLNTIIIFFIPVEKYCSLVFVTSRPVVCYQHKSKNPAHPSLLYLTIMPNENSHLFLLMKFEGDVRSCGFLGLGIYSL
jgi:hypothetical protein